MSLRAVVVSFKKTDMSHVSDTTDTFGSECNKEYETHTSQI